MLSFKKVAVIDHDWSLYRIEGELSGVYFDGCYAIIPDEDIIDDAFSSDLGRVSAYVINKILGMKLEAYYE